MMAGEPHPMHFCMDSDWLKGIVPDEATGMGSSSPSTEELIACPPQPDRRLRPQHDQPLKCPRCDSTHTKFCYYNNYSLSQPRYFCKTCRRYWTKGGSIRNVPVGGGCRKNKRASASASARKPSSAAAAAAVSALVHSPLHGGRRMAPETGILHLSFSGMQLPPPPSGANDPLCGLGLLDWKYDHMLAGSGGGGGGGGGGGFDGANSDAHYGAGMGMTTGGAEYHALNALRYAASLGDHHLALPFGTARSERDAMEMKPPAERLQWRGEVNRVPESSLQSGLSLWCGMLNGAHHHHGSSAAI